MKQPASKSRGGPPCPRCHLTHGKLLDTRKIEFRELGIIFTRARLWDFAPCAVATTLTAEAVLSVTWPKRCFARSAPSLKELTDADALG